MRKPHYARHLENLGYVRLLGSDYHYEHTAAGVCLSLGPRRVWGASTHLLAVTPEVLAEVARLHAAGIPICGHLLSLLSSTSPCK